MSKRRESWPVDSITVLVGTWDTYHAPKILEDVVSTNLLTGTLNPLKGSGPRGLVLNV